MAISITTLPRDVSIFPSTMDSSGGGTLNQKYKSISVDDRRFLERPRPLFANPSTFQPLNNSFTVRGAKLLGEEEDLEELLRRFNLRNFQKARPGVDFSEGDTAYGVTANMNPMSSALFGQTM